MEYAYRNGEKTVILNRWGRRAPRKSNDTCLREYIVLFQNGECKFCKALDYLKTRIKNKQFIQWLIRRSLKSLSHVKTNKKTIFESPPLSFQLFIKVGRIKVFQGLRNCSDIHTIKTKTNKIYIRPISKI